MPRSVSRHRLVPFGRSVSSHLRVHSKSKRTSRRSTKRSRSSSRGSSASCPKGQIKRKAYNRKTKTGKTVHVKAKCIKGRGKNPSKKGPKLIPPLRRGELKAFGYATKLPADERHAALAKALKKYPALSVFRKLNAVQVLTRNTAPKSSAVFGQDKAWIKKHYLGK